MHANAKGKSVCFWCCGCFKNIARLIWLIFMLKHVTRMRSSLNSWNQMNLHEIEGSAHGQHRQTAVFYCRLLTQWQLLFCALILWTAVTAHYSMNTSQCTHLVYLISSCSEAAEGNHSVIMCEDCPSQRLWSDSAAGRSGRPRHMTQGSETPAAGHRYRRSDVCKWSHKWHQLLLIQMLKLNI